MICKQLRLLQALTPLTLHFEFCKRHSIFELPFCCL